MTYRFPDPSRSLIALAGLPRSRRAGWLPRLLLDGLVAMTEHRGRYPLLPTLFSGSGPGNPLYWERAWARGDLLLGSVLAQHRDLKERRGDLPCRSSRPSGHHHLLRSHPVVLHVFVRTRDVLHTIDLHGPIELAPMDGRRDVRQNLARQIARAAAVGGEPNTGARPDRCC